MYSIRRKDRGRLNMPKFTETGLKKKIEKIKKDIHFQRSQRKTYDEEIERLKIVLQYYEQKLRDVKFKNPTDRSAS